MSHLLNQHRELHWKERENFVSHILRFSIYINISLNQPFFGLLTTRFHICHRSGQALVKSWVSACLTLFNQCCHHIKKWFSDSKIIGHMAFTFQMIGSRKNYIRNAQLPEFVTEMIGNAAGGETPGGQKRSVPVYNLLLQKVVLKLCNNIQIILQFQNIIFTYLN